MSLLFGLCIMAGGVLYLQPVPVEVLMIVPREIWRPHGLVKLSAGALGDSFDRLDRGSPRRCQAGQEKGPRSIRLAARVNVDPGDRNVAKSGGIAFLMQLD